MSPGNSEYTLRGFGLSRRDCHADPSIERPGKWSPGGKRYYSTSPFWKTRWEMSPMYTLASRSSFSGGSIVDYVKPYTPVDFMNRKMHAHNKKLQRPYLPRSLRRNPPPPSSLTPSPSTYFIPSLMGTGASVSIQNRHIDGVSFRKSVAEPGPAEYSTQGALGTYKPRYSVGGRHANSRPTTKQPGPADYDIKTIFDTYNISPTNYVPVFMRTKSE
jgi:hypothetical protein